MEELAFGVGVKIVCGNANLCGRRYNALCVGSSPSSYFTLQTLDTYPDVALGELIAPV